MKGARNGLFFDIHRQWFRLVAQLALLVEKKRVFRTPASSEPRRSAISSSSAPTAGVKIEPAKQWLPKRKGFVIEYHYQSGWGVKYPTLTPPCSRWRAFDPSDPRSSYVVLKLCIGWALERHHEQGGDASPYDFE